MVTKWRAWQHFHLDFILLISLLLLSILGLVILYSAGGEDLGLVARQAVRLGVGFIAMLILAQIPMQSFTRWIPWLYAGGILLLLGVIALGVVGKGAQRWLDLGFFRFQPSEIMKLIVPMTVAWYLADKPLPPSHGRLGVALLLIAVPTLLIAKQPDLGTSLLIAASGVFVLLLGGLSWRLVGGFIGLGLASLWPLWQLMHEYQRQRVRTFLDPEQDPLGAGYHIIQSKIAIGSGGTFGKGWLNGTQSHLEFLPERSTDFIFAVFSEEHGLLGVALLLLLYLFIVTRGLYMATQAQGTFARLLAGSISLTFFLYVFVNMGMVTGILPVVGLPLPLLSYGGTSVVTLMAGFGILMSIHTHRRLLSG